MPPVYTYAIVLDFEATCDDQNRPMPQEIIEFPSVLLCLRSLESLCEFESFVRPRHHPLLTGFCRELTSIRQEDVDAADPFAEVLARHRVWLRSHGLDERNALFVTCGDWDLKTMFPGQCAATIPPVEAVPAIYGRWQNIKHAFRSVTGRRKAPGMGGMLKAMGLSLVGQHHRGIDDCRNIAALYRELLKQGATTEVTSERPAVM